MDEQEEMELTEILLPQNNKFVKEFCSFPQEKQLQILKLGISTYTYSTQKFKSAIDGEKEIIIDNLTQNHNNELKKQEEKNKQLTSVIIEIKKKFEEEKELHQHTIEDKINEQKRIIKSNIERLYKDEIEKLTQKINILEEKKDALHSKTLSQQQEYYNKLFQEKQQSNDEINKIRMSCQEKIEEYRLQMETFQKVNQNSTLKGQRGEDIMYNILIELFPGCQIDTHTSKEGHKGDFSIIDDTHRGMIESKNYKKNVPKNEIQKFYNDIENNNEIDYAILCSLKSGVANKPKDFTLEFINGKPAIFLHKVKNSKKSVYLAYTVCKLILKNMDCFDITKEENQIKIKQIVKSYFQNHKKIVSMSNDYNKNVNEMLEKQLNDFNTILNLINITS